MELVQFARQGSKHFEEPLGRSEVRVLKSGGGGHGRCQDGVGEGGFLGSFYSFLGEADTLYCEYCPEMTGLIECTALLALKP